MSDPQAWLHNSCMRRLRTRSDAVRLSQDTLSDQAVKFHNEAPSKTSNKSETTDLTAAAATNANAKL